MAVSARMTVSRSPGPNVASARSVSLSVSTSAILPEVHAIEPETI